MSQFIRLLLQAAYVAVMQRVTQSNRAGYDSLLRVYRESDQSEERNRVLGSLVSCPDPDIILEVLNFLLTSEVRNQDAIFGLAVSSNRRETAWTWLKSNTKMSHFKGQARLPNFAVPKRYDVKLKPDLVSCKFSGSVAIDLDIVADTRFIVLNAADLSVNAASVSFTQPHSSKVFKPSKVDGFEEDGILVMEFEETLPIGLRVLDIGFEGILNDNMKGFYRSTYEHNGEKKNMAVTQFEPVDARRCFPCWDEPACKATFKITLEAVPSELVALSNMPVLEQKVNGPFKTVSYLETPIMSMYLVAIVVGLFGYVEDHTSDGVKVRVYCQVGKESQGKFALEVAVKTLELYRILWCALPFAKIGYALLFDEQHSSASSKQNVTITVAHELAHQWFGNLVTMEWWTDLWLNEGFATWVSYLATENLFPEWKIWTQFLDESTEGLRLDGLEEFHPIEVEINHAAEVDEIFDAISYTKGASVIRMLQNYLVAEPFQRSLAAYIKKTCILKCKDRRLMGCP
ncbi:hypothetical protein ACLB2K_017484 [Fragaria x ananassa]